MFVEIFFRTAAFSLGILLAVSVTLMAWLFFMKFMDYVDDIVNKFVWVVRHKRSRCPLCHEDIPWSK